MSKLQTIVRLSPLPKATLPRSSASQIWDQFSVSAVDGLDCCPVHLSGQNWEILQVTTKIQSVAITLKLLKNKSDRSVKGKYKLN